MAQAPLTLTGPVHGRDATRHSRQPFYEGDRPSRPTLHSIICICNASTTHANANRTSRRPATERRATTIRQNAGGETSFVPGGHGRQCNNINGPCSARARTEFRKGLWPVESRIEKAKRRSDGQLDSRKSRVTEKAYVLLTPLRRSSRTRRAVARPSRKPRAHVSHFRGSSGGNRRGSWSTHSCRCVRRTRELRAELGRTSSVAPRVGSVSVRAIAIDSAR